MTDEPFPNLTEALESRVDDPEQLERLVERLADSLPASVGPDILDSLEPLLVEAADPIQVLGFLGRMADSESGDEVFGDLRQVSVFVEAARQGAYPARTLLRHPEDLAYLAEATEIGMARGVTALIEELDQRRSAAAVDDLEAFVHQELRRLKRRESLRIFLREVRGQASLRETTHEIASVAEASLRWAVDRGAEALGRPELSDHFCVLGMGKLGGRELNFSSDVDLIYFASPRAGDDAELAEALDRLAKWVTSAMESVGEGGYVFRVDLRLRPEGSKGPLVPTLDAMEEYYQSWGRTWERSAMLKARPVAGNLALGDELLERLQPFLYRKYLDFGVIDELRGMKEKIDQNARASARIDDETEETQATAPPDTPSDLKSRLRAKMRSVGVEKSSGRRRTGRVSSGSVARESTSSEAARDGSAERGGVLGWDVKIGTGGIREIEFFVQALQLIHCGTRPHLRVRRTLDALDRLLYAGLISHEDHAVLADAYDLFRRVEHRIQMEHDRQSHRVPTDPDAFGRLARRLFVDEHSLQSRLADYRKRVSSMFQRLFEESEQSPDKPTVGVERSDEVATVLGAPLDKIMEQPVLDALESLGFHRTRQVAGQVQVLREKSWSPFGARASNWQAELASYLVATCAQAPDPDQAFSFWTRLVTAVGDRPGFYKMLHENPHATRLLMLVFGSSQFLGSIVVREPNVIEYALGAGTVALVRERDAMVRELRRRLEGLVDPSHRLGRLRRFQQEETLRIALHEIAGACDLMETVEQLSILAEVCLRGVLQEVYDGLRAGQGSDDWPDFEALPFVVLAMGKLGGRELGFGSDLDIIFVYEAMDEVGLDHPMYARLAQRLVRQLSSVSEQGKLYEVDTRLRPSGQQGTLVVSMDAFRDYHSQNADLWERQALIRARPVSGPRSLAASVMEVRRRAVFDAELPGEIRQDFARMRDKISEHLGGDTTEFNIKTSPGGMLDVEFMTQYLQLVTDVGRDAAADSGRDWLAGGIGSQNTMQALAALADADALPGVDLRGVLRDYQMLRRVEARLRVADLRDHNVLPADEDGRLMLARRLGYQGEDATEQLMADVQASSGRIRAAFEAVMR